MVKMKIVISKSQWEIIGKEAGWLKMSSRSYNKSFERQYDDIDGKSYGQPGKYYSVSIKGDFLIVDDSDYSYPSGYGKYVYVKSVDLNEIEITEYDETGVETGNEISIQRDNPILYSQLVEMAEERAKNDWNG